MVQMAACGSRESPIVPSAPMAFTDASVTSLTAAHNHFLARGAAIPSRVSGSSQASTRCRRRHRRCCFLPALACLPCLFTSAEHLSAGMLWRPSPMPAPAWASWQRMAWCWRQRSASPARWEPGPLRPVLELRCRVPGLSPPQSGSGGFCPAAAGWRCSTCRRPGLSPAQLMLATLLVRAPAPAAARPLTAAPTATQLRCPALRTYHAASHTPAPPSHPPRSCWTRRRWGCGARRCTAWTTTLPARWPASPPMPTSWSTPAACRRSATCSPTRWGRPCCARAPLTLLVGATDA